MSRDALLQVIFIAIVCCHLCSSSSFTGQLSKDDKASLDIYFGKLLGEDCVAKQTFSIGELILAADKIYFARCPILNIVYTL